jgi:hypothetical protein
MMWTKVTAAVGIVFFLGLTYMALTGFTPARGPVFAGWALLFLIIVGSKVFPPTRPLPKFKDRSAEGNDEADGNDQPR